VPSKCTIARTVGYVSVGSRGARRGEWGPEQKELPKPYTIRAASTVIATGKTVLVPIRFSRGPMSPVISITLVRPDQIRNSCPIPVRKPVTCP
jgi:hypothetical protein